MHREESIEACKILIVDDNPANVLLVVRFLEFSGFKNIRSTYDSTEVLGIFQEWHPDLIVLDLHMPKMTGYQVLAEIKEAKSSDEYLPILVFTADVTSDAKRMALEGGAADFLTKPGDATEIILRVRNFLRMRLLYQSLAEQNHLLEEKVHERTKQLEDAQLEVVYRLARVAEYRDDNTGEHAQRVGVIAARIAEKLGLESKEVSTIRLAATLHDLGKVGISDAVLLKPGKLTPEEFEVIKKHPELGANVLTGSRCELLQVAEAIALTHHERWDGEGYPKGLKGDEIPVFGRIVAVADVYDALTSERPYKVSMSQTIAIDEIRRCAGTHFDPEVVQAFISCFEADLEAVLPIAA